MIACENRHVPDRLVTVSTFAHAHEAQIAKNALEAAGIDSIIVGQYSALASPHESVVGSVKLQVREDDIEDADAVLNQMQGIDHAEYVRPSDADEFAPPARCERCGSPDVRRLNKLAIFAAISALVAIIFGYLGQTLSAFYVVIVVGVFLLVSARWQCRHCGYRW
jgi:putative signal transducing protein